MLYETLFQGPIFMCVLFYGLICGFFFDAKKLIEKSLSHNKVVCFVLDLAFMLVSVLLFIHAKRVCNYGELRLYLLVAFVLGNILEHISLGFLVEKFLIMVYNGFVKIKRKIFCYKPKSKFMQKILK